VRQPFSPAACQPQLGSHSSPAASAPFVRDLFHLSLPANRLPYGLGHTLPLSEPLPAPSAMYRSAVQQRQQQQEQQQRAQQSQQPVAGAGLEVETSKFTRVVHSHSPSYQAVVSSTVEVVRQSQSMALQHAAQAAPLGPFPQHPAAVMVEELPPNEPMGTTMQGPSRQQEQQHREEQQASPVQQQPAALNGPLACLPGAASAEAPASTQAAAVPSEAAAPAAAVAATMAAAAAAGAAAAPDGAAPAPVEEQGIAQAVGRPEPAPHMPPPRHVVPVQEGQQLFSGEEPAAVESGDVGAPPVPRSPAHTLSGLRSSGEQREEDGGAAAAPSSMQRAMAQVGTIVRDLSSPTPEQTAEEPSSGRQGGDLPLQQQGQGQQQPEARSSDGGAGVGAGSAEEPAPRAEGRAAEQSPKQPARMDTSRLASPATRQQRRRQQQQQEQQETQHSRQQPLREREAPAAAGEAKDRADADAAVAAAGAGNLPATELVAQLLAGPESSTQQSEPAKSKPVGSKGGKKRAKAEAARGTGAKRYGSCRFTLQFGRLATIETTPCYGALLLFVRRMSY
jgi:hypothetical protein